MVEPTEIVYIEETRTTFHIRPDKIAVENPIQFFLIKPSTRYQYKRYSEVIEMIKLGQIKSGVQLISDHGKSVQLVYYQKSWFYKDLAKLA